MAVTKLEEMKHWSLARKLGAFQAASGELRKAIRRFPRGMWGFSPKPGTHWCIHEVIWHLADAEMNASIRFRQALAQPGTVLMVWDQEKWGAAPPYRKLDVATALDVFFALRRANAELLKRIPKSAWKHKVKHPEFGVRTLESLVAMNTWHVHNHIGQMQRRYDQWKGRKA